MALMMRLGVLEKYLVSGRDAWHYIEVKRHLVPNFLKRTRSGNVDVAEFGAVLMVSKKLQRSCLKLHVM